MESKESREKEPRERNVVLYFVRHGDAGYSGRQDMSGFLTEKGKEQAQKAAEDLYQELPKEAIVEFISSDLKRSDQTTKEMKEKLEELNEDPQNAKKILIHNNRINEDGDSRRPEIKTYKKLAISDEHTKEFFRLSRDAEGNRQDAVTAWLNNPDKTVEEMENDFRNLIRHFDRLSHHVSSGPDIYIVATTHGGKADVAIGRFLDENLKTQLNNCEAFKISLLANGQTTLTFRDKTKNVSI